MSNKRKLKMNPIQMAAAKRAARCPDCQSTVRIEGERTTISHDDTCPTLAELEASGRARGATATVISQDGQASHVTFGKLPGLDVPVAVFSDSMYRESRE